MENVMVMTWLIGHEMVDEEIDDLLDDILDLT